MTDFRETSKRTDFFLEPASLASSKTTSLKVLSKFPSSSGLPLLYMISRVPGASAPSAALSRSFW